jgi:YHS domain-containing protein
MKKCHLNSCDKEADKNFELNAEAYTPMEFHLTGPYYKFCSENHLKQWKEENK